MAGRPKTREAVLTDSVKEIIEWRHNAGMSQAKFAKHFGMSIRVIQSWEIGDRVPPEWVAKLVLAELKRYCESEWSKQE